MMTDTRADALQFMQEHQSRFIDQMGELLSIPSVSTDADHLQALQEAAQWVAGYLKGLGLAKVQLFPPETHPLVYAESLQAGPDAPTVLIYGHYDVQPAEPLENWHTDPFKPVVREGQIYARGATDMKGQVMATIYAVESILKSGTLPVNVKFMIEGEEEIGSPNLGEFIASNKELLACDFCLNPDTGMLAPDLPTITHALRGLAYFELRVYGPQQDLHSGVYGGMVHNPAQALCELIAGMHDKNGQITLPGFYEDVRPLEAEERAELARLPFTDQQLLARTGAPRLWGEPEFTPLERVGARPTLEVNGLYSGFIEPGAKTVLPAYAMAKISTRLVPDQDSGKIRKYLEAYLRENAPATIRWELTEMVHSPASISDRKSPWVQAMIQAQESVWGKRPLFKREGGSVPVVTQLQEILGIDSVNVGCALPEDNMHGPDEKMNLQAWQNSLASYIHFFYNLAQ